MSGSLPAATPQRQGPKVMSSRLANMKFMQRAAATPLPQSPSTPVSDNEPAAKRAKASQPQASSSQIKSTPEASRAEALRPLGIAGAETMWTLWTGDSTTHRIEDPAGEDDGIAPWADEGGFKSGRLRYGGFKKAAEKATDTVPDEEDGEVPEDSNSDDEPSDAENEAEKLAKDNLSRVREVRAQRAKVERDKSRKVVGERRKKEVRMNPRKGISSGGQR